MHEITDNILELASLLFRLLLTVTFCCYLPVTCALASEMMVILSELRRKALRNDLLLLLEGIIL